jgi:sRNA-binding protein
MPKQESRLFCLLLQADHPKVFSWNDPVPLAIGIHRDIKLAYPGVSKKTLNRCMAFWVRQKSYVRKIAESKPGAKRYLLDGRECGIISTVERKYAKEMLEQIECKPVTVE